MCVEAVEFVEKSGNFLEISLLKPKRLRVLSVHIGSVSLYPVVKRTGLGLLCLSKSRRVPRMCVGAVESGEWSGNIREISLLKQKIL